MIKAIVCKTCWPLRHLSVLAPFCTVAENVAKSKPNRMLPTSGCSTTQSVKESYALRSLKMPQEVEEMQEEIDRKERICRILGSWELLSWYAMNNEEVARL